MTLNSILRHLKATLLSFTSSLFIVWAFMSCVLELDSNPECHTQNHMVHLFPGLRTQWDSACQNLPSIPTSTCSDSAGGKENIASMPSLKGAVLLMVQGGIGQHTARVPGRMLYVTVQSLLYGPASPHGASDTGEHQSLSITTMSPLHLMWTLAWQALSGQKEMLCHFVSKIKQMPFSPLPNVGWMF